jgi:hypothetical protein
VKVIDWMLKLIGVISEDKPISTDRSICTKYADGSKSWYRNDERHREDGPAVEYANGSKFWFLNGKLHREDGPAYEYADGEKQWWYHGKQLDCNTQEEFERLMKLRAFW